MPLFQTTVLNKYLKQQDGACMAAAYAAVQANIQQAQALQAQIARTDREIDGLVYGLYGLGEQEIAVWEGKN